MAQERTLWPAPEGGLKARMCTSSQAARKEGLLSGSYMNSTGSQGGLHVSEKIRGFSLVRPQAENPAPETTAQSVHQCCCKMPILEQLVTLQ